MVTGVFSIPFPGQTVRIANDSNRLDHRFRRLKQFIAGDENRAVSAAIQSVMLNHQSSYNPLVFYGPSGTGKSHLALGLAHHFNKTNPNATATSFTAIDFARKCFVDDSADKGKLDQDQHYVTTLCYDSVDMLVIDDIHQMPDKLQPQYDLVHLIDRLIQRDVHLIFTSRLNPINLSHLIAPLRSRLSMGLCLRIAKPGIAARLAIINELAATRAIVIGSAAAALLASKFRATVPDLLGALIELELTAIQKNNSITLQQVEQFIKTKQQQNQLSIHKIASVVATFFDTKLSDLKGTSRQKSFVLARGVTVFLTRELTEMSLEQIGTFLSNRDHTTILHSYRKIQTDLQKNIDLHHSVHQIKNILFGR